MPFNPLRDALMRPSAEASDPLTEVRRGRRTQVLTAVAVRRRRRTAIRARRRARRSFR